MPVGEDVHESAADEDKIWRRILKGQYQTDVVQVTGY